MKNIIKAIIGLGNPGPSYHFTRHNIGFRVLDTLAERYGGQWRTRDNGEYASIVIQEHPLLLVKPMTYMNSSGQVIPFLRKQGIGVENIIVVHDELEKKFGTIALKKGGSARGHNGLKSIIAACGEDFLRIRCGIDRPDNKDEVPTYVLSTFKEERASIDAMIDSAIQEIEKSL